MAAHKANRGGERNARGDGAKSSGMTVAEAGRRGGNTTSERHGRNFYATIGRKGGKARSARLQVDEGEKSS